MKELIIVTGLCSHDATHKFCRRNSYSKGVVFRCACKCHDVPQQLTLFTS